MTSTVESVHTKRKVEGKELVTSIGIAYRLSAAFLFLITDLPYHVLLADLITGDGILKKQKEKWRKHRPTK